MDPLTKVDIDYSKAITHLNAGQRLIELDGGRLDFEAPIPTLSIAS